MRLKAIVAVLLLLLVGACGGGKAGGPPAANDAPQPATPEAPPLLPDGAAHRTVGLYASSFTFTADDLCAAGDAQMTGTDLKLGASGLSWAIVGVNPESQVPAGLELTGTLDGDLYLGVADYARGTWTWIGAPLRELGPIDLPAGITPSPQGSLYFALLCPAGSQASVSLDLTFTPQEQVWNFMIWLAADNNLAPFAVQELNSLEAVAISPNIRILAGYDICSTEFTGESFVAGTDQVHFIRVVPDSNYYSINTIGDPANMSFPRAGFDSADPARLTEFLDWAERNFPCTNILLLLWDHGSGWRGGWDGQTGTEHGSSGMLCDREFRGYMLTSIHAWHECLIGRGIDVLVLNSCYMGEVEVAYEFRDTADWVVGCCREIQVNSIPFNSVVEDLLASGSFTPQQLVKSITQHSPELTACNSARLTDLAAGLNAISAAVSANAASERPAFQSAVLNCPTVEGTSNAKIIPTFFRSYQECTINPEIQAMLAQAQNAYLSATVNGCGSEAGISIYTPAYGCASVYALEEYAQLSFNQSTNWLDMLAPSE